MSESSTSGTHGSRRRREKSPLRKAGKILETIGAVLLCALIVATPWLFGTTEEWSVRWMNLGSFCAGAIMLGAALCNRLAGGEGKETGRERIVKYVFLGLNLAVLAYCAIALWNWRATFSLNDRSFNYRESYNASLPTTYDADLTRNTLLSLFACFVVFWSLRYWIMQGERRSRDSEDVPMLRNKRFQVVAWVLSLNGLAIAVQGVLQRLSGSSKLLWIRDSWWGKPLACFGPFSYRGNAADYLNLIWPLALGFWWYMKRERRRKSGSSRVFTDGPELLLIPATFFMVAGSIITLSRGGGVVALGILIGVAIVSLLQKNISRGIRIGTAVFVCAVLACVWFLASKDLQVRYKAIDFTEMGGRADIYKNAPQMAKDFPVFGTGPGSFQSVYHLYRTDPGDLWHGFLHDDWLETRITFGWVGFGLILANFLVLAIWIMMPGRFPVPRAFTWCALAGLVGTMVHAKFDFPFQTYSIYFTFVVVAAVICSVSPERR